MFLNIKTPYISYEIEFNRKVTIIQGDSGTGKSKIIETRNEMWDTGLGEIYTSNNIPVSVIENIPDWERILDVDETRLFIVDEDCNFVMSNRFADIVHRSRSYFIIINRDPIKGLNYSYKDIYEMKNSGKFNRTVRKYNDEDYSKLEMSCETILVEDSNSGMEFYRFHLDSNIISMGGKSKIIESVKNLNIEEDTTIGIIVDGAAIGNEMTEITSLRSKFENVNFSVFMPECVEELIVNSDIINFRNLRKIISNVDKNRYTSYENMYYKILKEETNNTPAIYSKTSVNSCYTKNCCHKPCSKCKFYSKGDKKVKVKGVVFGINKEESDDKLLF